MILCDGNYGLGAYGMDTGRGNSKLGNPSEAGQPSSCL